MKRIQLVPNLITLANAFCGLLAIAKAIDALALSGDDPIVFYRKMETACLLIFLGMVFDSLDGFVARLTRAYSDFGAQLDSFSDALTFGVAPAMLAKVLIEHEGALTGWEGDSRLHFLAAAAFALMAILRLVRFNLETEHEKSAHAHFKGLPSPAAAGAVASTIWLYLILRRPELEVVEGTPTTFQRVLGWMEGVDWSPVLAWVPGVLVCMLPLLGLLMVSNVRYLHPVIALSRGRTQFVTLVVIVFSIFLFLLAPVPFAYVLFNGFVVMGLVHMCWSLARGRKSANSESQPGP
ncbi:MAG: CDP-diacylglycerol--serine O-phosphatidyltransferase [Planctomycetota bacterium]